MTTITLAELYHQASLEPWAILPERLHAILAAAAAGAPAQSADPERLAITRPGPKVGRLARVPILGAITRRDSFWSMFFGGGASVEGLIQTLRTVAADPSIGTVLLDIDSPGGTVSGMPELAAEVRKLAESKHVVAMANSLAASAAYWIASQADEVVAAPEAMVGSIGVFAVHEDWSKLMDTLGIKVTYIHAGKYKVEGNPDEPLSEDARAHMQSVIDDSYGLFVGDVAAGRGVSTAAVKSDYGEGRVLTPTAAKAAGMIDRVASFSDTVARLASKSSSGNSLALKSRRLDMSERI